jgi:hypothetical protein
MEARRLSVEVANSAGPVTAAAGEQTPFRSTPLGPR